MRALITATVATCAFMASAQVLIDKPVVLDGASDAQRQLKGLAPSQAQQAAQSAVVEQGGAHRFSAAGSGPVWQVDLPSLAGVPAPGTQMVVAVPGTPGTGTVWLTVNGQGPYTIIDAPGDTLLAESVSTLPMLSLVFDGNAFHLLNGATHRRRDCPEGMVTVNSQYCIEPSERDTSNWFEAARICVAENKRLCGWGEWYNACTNAAVLGLATMIGNWEWTDDSANEDECVRIAGYATCTQATAWFASGNAEQHFRCCYSR